MPLSRSAVRCPRCGSNCSWIVTEYESCTVYRLDRSCCEFYSGPVMITENHETNRTKKRHRTRNIHDVNQPHTF